jgi:hypothetical protein
MMLEEQGLFGGEAATAKVTGNQRWAGIEPSINTLLSDPIAVLLMRADRLTLHEVEIVLRTARHRRAGGGMS